MAEQYKSLYRKWRPKVFADVFGQEHVIKVLENQVINNKTSHAYLFTGSRGTGKTTCAKILAKAVNCETPINGSPCNVCETCIGIENGGIIDVIEMDAASNSRVEDMREVLEEVVFTPGGASKKVYIIDEVHMLSISAFNALLKTLEEPPPHIIFILATTELNKIPKTILSRCQRHDFRRITPEIIAERLKIVCAGENIEAEERAINIIANLAGGAMRDALSILEVAVENNNIDNVIKLSAARVLEICGSFESGKIIEICECISANNAEGALKIFWDLFSGSLDCANFCSSLLEMWRNLQVAKLMRNNINELRKYIVIDSESENEFERIIKLAESFESSELMRCYNLTANAFSGLSKFAANKKIAVEMLLCEMCFKPISNVNVVGNVNLKENNNDVVFVNVAPKIERIERVENRENNINNNQDFPMFAEIIEYIKKVNAPIYGFIKDSKYSFKQENEFGKLTILVKNDSALYMLNKDLNLIKDAVNKFVENCIVEIVLDNSVDGLKEVSEVKKSEEVREVKIARATIDDIDI